MHRVRVVECFEPYSVVAEYQAETHPAKGGIILIGSRRYTVVGVNHVIGTLDKGTYEEKNVLSFVELEVMK